MTEIIFIAFLLGVVISIMAYSWRFGITPTPTSYPVKQTLLRNLPDLNTDQIILELGSGWGTVAFALADHYPECVVRAYEISLIPFFASFLRKFLRPKANLHFERKDFFLISFENAALIFCYLYPAAMVKLKEKLQNEIKPGTYVISHTFAIPGWVPQQTIYANDLYKTPIYIYVPKPNT